VERVSKVRLGVYLQPLRTLEPVTGVGRHINSIVRELKKSSEFESIRMICSKQWVGDNGELDRRSPFFADERITYPYSERVAERTWKLFGRPFFDAQLPDIDVVYSPSDVVLPLRSIPSCITLHDIYPLDPLYPFGGTGMAARLQKLLWSISIPKMYRASTRLLTVSEFCKSRMVELLRFDPEKIDVIGNGVEEKFFHPDAFVMPAIEGLRHPYVVVVGGLSDRKGAQHIVGVARQLKAQKSGVQVVVIGSNEPKWEAVARSLENVLILGRRPDEDLIPILHRSTALLFLSLYEGFGIPAVEAMAVGTPVIASNCSALPEVVGEGGFVFPPDDYGLIERQIDRLVASPSSAAEVIEKGKQRAAAYRWDKCANRVKSSLTKAIHTNGMDVDIALSSAEIRG
jgi:glycosyltransferase involved in cell wall biosynthesis